MQISDSLQQLKGKNPTHKKKGKKEKKKQNSAHLLNLLSEEFPERACALPSHSPFLFSLAHVSFVNFVN